MAAALLLAAGCAPHPQPEPPTEAAALALTFEAFDALAGTIPATVGLAVVPVGSTAVSTVGSWSTGVSWSTIKVPLAIAALQADRPNAHALAVAAITRSDNAAAEQMWAELGPPEHAARQVQEVLTAAGDTETPVESRRLRAGFTAFGQTQWSLARQALFAAHLPCLVGAEPVVQLMHNLVGEQRWGLAGIGGAAKGGWGPGEYGGYLVRQFGIINTRAGQLGVALAAEPYAGTYAAGVDATNRIAAWLTAHTTDLPGGSCPE